MSPKYLGRAVTTSTFRTHNDRYRWLNLTYAVIEALCTGPLDLEEPETERWRLRAFECVHDLAVAP